MLPTEKEFREAGVIRVDRDLRTLNRDELAEIFASKRSGKIKLQKLMRAVIWQAFEEIESGRAPGIEGNIRSLWYRYIKPVLSHMEDDDSHKSDPSKIMSRVLEELVMERHLFKYADFDFTDENWSVRKIGAKRPEVLVFTEKRGWVRFFCSRRMLKLRRGRISRDFTAQPRSRPGELQRPPASLYLSISAI